MTTIEDDILFDLLFPEQLDKKMEQQQNNHEVGQNGKE